MSMTMASAETTELRFSVGTRVECKLGAEWKSGTVCIHFFTQDNFPKGMCVPYQIALDEGNCFGVHNDEVTPTTDDAGLFDLIAKTPAILATFR